MVLDHSTKYNFFGFHSEKEVTFLEWSLVCFEKTVLFCFLSLFCWTFAVWTRDAESPALRPAAWFSMTNIFQPPLLSSWKISSQDNWGRNLFRILLFSLAICFCLAFVVLNTRCWIPTASACHLVQHDKHISDSGWVQPGTITICRWWIGGYVPTSLYVPFIPLVSPKYPLLASTAISCKILQFPAVFLLWCN